MFGGFVLSRFVVVVLWLCVWLFCGCFVVLFVCVCVLVVGGGWVCLVGVCLGVGCGCCCWWGVGVCVCVCVCANQQSEVVHSSSNGKLSVPPLISNDVVQSSINDLLVDQFSAWFLLCKYQKAVTLIHVQVRIKY